MSKPKTKLESAFQHETIEEIKQLLPGCLVQKLDSSYQQGIPDWLILWRWHWGVLEFKRKRPTSPSDFEPNQEYFVELCANMSFGAVIYPENKDEVLDALQQAFRSRRSTRATER